MCIIVTLLLLCLVVAAFFSYLSCRRPRNYPPGPPWLPFLGNMLDIRKIIKREKYLHKALTYLSHEYNSPIIGLKLGENLTVVVSGLELIQEVLKKDEFEGRPDNFFIRLRSMGTRRGVTCTDGLLWQDQRAFVLRHLRNLGYGKQNMDEILHTELRQLRNNIDTLIGENVRIGPKFATAVLNVLWTHVAGARLSSFNFYLEKMLALLEKRTRIFDMSGGLLNHVPWLRFVAPNYTGYRVIMDINKDLKALFQEVIAEHESTYDPHETRDLIDAFIHQMKNTEDGDKNGIYTVDQLIMICLDLFIAGSQTTSNTLDFAVRLMVLYPDVQKKVRKEIWSVTGREHPPSPKDRVNLPYVEAVLMECYRICHVTPVAGPRRVLRDTTLHGYNIPKDTSILINLDSVHMNEEYWDDPQDYRPERFLNTNGTLKPEENLITFGLGRRRCLGEVLARSCIFTFFTGLIQQYQVKNVPGEYPHCRAAPGLTLAPTPYHVIFSPVEGE